MLASSDTGAGSGTSSGGGVVTMGGGQELAFTGVNVLGFGIPAIVPIVIGAVVILFTRRRKAIR